MSYSTGEAAILTRLQACTGFSSTNTGRMNWKLLNSGASDHYGVIRPGAFTLEWITINTYSAAWTTIIEVYQRYTDETTTYTNLYTYVNAVLAMLAYPNFGAASTVFDGNITGGSEPEEVWTAGGEGPLWLRWRINIEWQEHTTVTFSE